MDRRFPAPLLLAAAAFVAAGGYVHAREWSEIYRDVPASVPGSEVVTIGFPVNVAVSAIVVVALVVSAAWRPGWARIVAVGALAFQAASIGALVVTHEASLFGWTQPVYTPGAQQSLAVEVGAVVCLLAVLALDLVRRRAGDAGPVVSQAAG